MLNGLPLNRIIPSNIFFFPEDFENNIYLGGGIEGKKISFDKSVLFIGYALIEDALFFRAS